MYDEDVKEVARQCVAKLQEMELPNMSDEVLIKVWKMEPGNLRVKGELMERINKGIINSYRLVDIIEFCDDYL